MPQLDIAAFLPQIFWLCVIFTIFYLVALNNVLPMLSTILKVRFKKLSQGQEILERTDLLNNSLKNNVSKSLSKVSQTSQTTLLNMFYSGKGWLSDKKIQELSSQSTISDVHAMNSAYLNVTQQLMLQKVFYKSK